MANPVKNQHYVPQFYLREFAESNEQLYVYDKRTDKIFPTHVKNVAHESYFYDIPKGWGDSTINRQVYEKKLSGIEAVYKRVLAVVLNHEGSGSLDFGAIYRHGLGSSQQTQLRRPLTERLCKLLSPTECHLSLLSRTIRGLTVKMVLRCGSL
jgi:Protein of unknown function (DUF4238)